VPMIVFAIVLALATVSFPVGPVVVTLAAAVSIAACAFYFKLAAVNSNRDALGNYNWFFSNTRHNFISGRTLYFVLCA